MCKVLIIRISLEVSKYECSHSSVWFLYSRTPPVHSLSSQWDSKFHNNMEKENSNFEQFSMYVLIQKTAKQKILIRMKARIPRIYKA